MKEKEITIKSNNVFKGRIISVFNDEVKCPNGNISNREVVRHHGGVCILAFDENGDILMEKQYRYPYDEFIFELPAGKLEAGEDSKIAGIRELEEETGYVVDDLINYGVMYPSVGYCDEIIYLYVAKNLKKGHVHFDEDEDLEVIHISLDKAKEMINDGSIKDAKTICLISKYLLNN